MLRRVVDAEQQEGEPAADQRHPDAGVHGDPQRILGSLRP